MLSTGDGFVPLQTGADPVAVAGTLGLFAAFLSVTAHIAARNVLGDVPVTNALGVGPLPAAVAVLSQAFGLPSIPSLLAALLLDGLAIHYLYEREPKLSAYVTLIHFVVSVILGAVLFSLLALLSSAPT